jgi:hypothetical protein
MGHQPWDDGAQGLLQHRFVKPAEKTVHRRRGRDVLPPKGRPQFRGFGPTHFGVAEGPLFIPHQPSDGQQLRRLALMVRNFAAGGRQDGLGNAQRNCGQCHSP